MCMTKIGYKQLLVAVTSLAAFFSVTSVGSEPTENKMRQLIRQLDLFVSEKIIQDQAPQLSQEFREQFKTRPQLKLAPVKQYFSTHPTEVMAFRRYIQQLTNIGFITSDLAESLVIAAFQSLEQAPKNQVLARSSVESPNRSLVQDHRTDSSTAVLDLSESSEDLSNSDKPIDINTKPPSIDFGESLEKAQKKALAVQELEDQILKDKEIERNKMLARALIDEFSRGKPSPESIGQRVERVVTAFAETESKKQAETFLDSVEISVNSITGKPEYEIRGLKAFDDNNPHHFAFSEIGVTATGDDTTLNIGFGIRKLNKDQTTMGGINAFYDQEVETGHKRGSIGIELVGTPYKLNANRYYRLSDGKAITALRTEKPMSGHDVDVEVALPYLPGLFAGYNQSRWYGEDGVADVERKSYRVTGNLSKNLSVEVGKRTYSSNVEDQNTAKLSYNYVFGADTDNPSLLDIDSQPYRPKKIGQRERYRMVERENKIVTQVSQSGLQVTFTAL